MPDKDLLVYAKPLAGLLLLSFMIWYFSGIVIYLIISIVLSLMGRPLLRIYLVYLSFGKWQMPRSLASLLTLLSMIAMLSLFLIFIVPLITSQANMIYQIEPDDVAGYFREPLNDLQAFLVQFHVLNSNESLAMFIDNKVEDMLDLTRFTNIASYLVTATGSILIGVFIILFFTFFFLKDPGLVRNSILVLTPEKYVEDMEVVITESRYLLSRYFLGLLAELATMMTLISLGLSILGVKNALIIGFLGGLMNVIPYLGPIIGASLGVVLGVISSLSLGLYDELLWITLKVLGTFATANLIDNMVLQPLIYSTSVKAHPVEIFLVIIMAGQVAGIPGMILAIPTYTLFRVIAKKFLNQLRIVKALTERLER